MAFSYIVDADTNSEIGASKIKLLFLDKKTIENPYIPYRVAPDQSEALKFGGQRYSFYVGIGMEAAGRQTDLNKDNSIKLTEGAKAKAKVLEVTNPLQWPAADGTAFPIRSYDSKLTDGVNFSASANAGLVKGLKLGEVEEDRKHIDESIAAGEIRVLETAETTVLGVLRAIRQAGIDYATINASNTNWAPEVLEFFHQKRYSYTKSEVDLHIHPADVMRFSEVNLESGAGSTPQFLQYEDGELKAVGGYKVIENPFTPLGTVEFWPKNQIGTPDTEMMETNIFDEKMPLTKTRGLRGEHFYNSILVTPQLITSVKFSSLVRGEASLVTPTVEAPTATAGAVTATADGGTFSITVDTKGQAITASSVTTTDGTVAPTALINGTNSIAVTGLAAATSATVSFSVTTVGGTASGTADVTSLSARKAEKEANKSINDKIAELGKRISKESNQELKSQLIEEMKVLQSEKENQK